MSADLTGKRIAILATDGVEGVELTSPREALEQAGATVELLAPDGRHHPALGPRREGRHARRSTAWCPRRTRTSTTASSSPVASATPTTCAWTRPSVQFVTAIVRRGVPVGVICHGAWILIEAWAVNGRTLTSYPSLRTDLQNAGRALGRRRGPQRPRARLEPAARRPPGVQRQDRRGVRRGRARAQGGLTQAEPPHADAAQGHRGGRAATPPAADAPGKTVSTQRESGGSRDRARGVHPRRPGAQGRGRPDPRRPVGPRGPRRHDAQAGHDPARDSSTTTPTTTPGCRTSWPGARSRRSATSTTATSSATTPS